jgi:transcriptional regulator with XRE-family HTH domain
MFHVKPDARKQLANRIKQARLDASARSGRQITQTEIAEKLGVTQATIGRWESGAVEPDLAMIRLLAEYLGTDPRDVAFGPVVQDDPLPKRKVR